MKFKITEDKKFLQVIESTQLELEQLTYSFTKKVDNWFIIKKKLKNSNGWDGEVKYIDRYNRIPIGLWQELNNFSNKYNFNLEIEGSEIFTDKDYNGDDFDKWARDYFKDAENFYPRDYQLKAAKKILKFRLCTEEISTSGGKTLIAFMIFKYLIDREIIKSMLYVVPNINLVTQTEEKFYEYEEKCGKRPSWNSECIFSGAKKAELNDRVGLSGNLMIKPKIIFGTYQSLVKRDEEYFSQFNSVCIDECLHPDTLITMKDFSKKKIKNIKIGEYVWTKNEKTNKNELKEIEFVYKNLSENQQMFEIETETETIKITGNHKILTKGNIWKRVDELTENDDIISFDTVNI